jgi:hypothetical protein
MALKPDQRSVPGAVQVCNSIVIIKRLVLAGYCGSHPVGSEELLAGLSCCWRQIQPEVENETNNLAIKHQAGAVPAES